MTTELVDRRRQAMSVFRPAVPVDGELELLPGIRLVPTPGHTSGSQVVTVETGGQPVVVCGDTAVFHAELYEPRTEG